MGSSPALQVVKRQWQTVPHVHDILVGDIMPCEVGINLIIPRKSEDSYPNWFAYHAIVLQTLEPCITR
jgi:hypothetical protein